VLLNYLSTIRGAVQGGAIDQAKGLLKESLGDTLPDLRAEWSFILNFVIDSGSVPDLM
jgi:hypothetical protein